MHEFGLVDSIVNMASESAKQAGAVRVTQIDLVVGELTQVVQEAMDFAFEALAAGTICEGAKLNIQYVRAHGKCSDCGAEFDYDIMHTRCPECDSPYTTCVDGRQMYVDKIEVDMP